ncbi:MAG: InlB B-repeat-containing protein [Oscillospiraceae bacterium]|nr:InlB B-repeat-containing protein [Oscillospiraceae bacterium]
MQKTAHSAHWAKRTISWFVALSIVAGIILSIPMSFTFTARANAPDVPGAITKYSFANGSNWLNDTGTAEQKNNLAIVDDATTGGFVKNGPAGTWIADRFIPAPNGHAWQQGNQRTERKKASAAALANLSAYTIQHYIRMDSTNSGWQPIMDIGPEAPDRDRGKDNKLRLGIRDSGELQYEYQANQLGNAGVEGANTTVNSTRVGAVNVDTLFGGDFAGQYRVVTLSVTSGRQATLYIDNETSGTTVTFPTGGTLANLNSASNAAHPFSLGLYPMGWIDDSARYSLDDMRIYNTNFSASQVAEAVDAYKGLNGKTIADLPAQSNMVMGYDFDPAKWDGGHKNIVENGARLFFTDSFSDAAIDNMDPVQGTGSLADGAANFLHKRPRRQLQTENAEPLNRSEYSMSTWVKFDQSGRQFFFTAADYSTDGNQGKKGNNLVWLVTPDNVLKFEQKHNNETVTKAVESGGIKTNEWNLLTVTQKGGTVKMYVNDRMVIQQDDWEDFNPSRFAETAKMNVGGNGIWNDAWNLEESMAGQMDEFRIYDKELTSSEISQLFEYFKENSAPDAVIGAANSDFSSPDGYEFYFADGTDGVFVYKHDGGNCTFDLRGTRGRCVHEGGNNRELIYNFPLTHTASGKAFVQMQMDFRYKLEYSASPNGPWIFAENYHSRMKLPVIDATDYIDQGNIFVRVTHLPETGVGFGDHCFVWGGFVTYDPDDERLPGNSDVRYQMNRSIGSGANDRNRRDLYKYTWDYNNANFEFGDANSRLFTDGDNAEILFPIPLNTKDRESIKMQILKMNMHYGERSQIGISDNKDMTGPNTVFYNRWHQQEGTNGASPQNNPQLSAERNVRSHLMEGQTNNDNGRVIDFDITDIVKSGSDYVFVQMRNGSYWSGTERQGSGAGGNGTVFWGFQVDTDYHTNWELGTYYRGNEVADIDRLSISPHLYAEAENVVDPPTKFNGDALRINAGGSATYTVKTRNRANTSRRYNMVLFLRNLEDTAQTEFLKLEVDGEDQNASADLAAGGPNAPFVANGTGSHIGVYLKQGKESQVKITNVSSVPIEINYIRMNSLGAAGLSSNAIPEDLRFGAQASNLYTYGDLARSVAPTSVGTTRNLLPTPETRNRQIVWDAQWFDATLSDGEGAWTPFTRAGYHNTTVTGGAMRSVTNENPGAWVSGTNGLDNRPGIFQVDQVNPHLAVRSAAPVSVVFTAPKDGVYQVPAITSNAVRLGAGSAGNTMDFKVLLNEEPVYEVRLNRPSSGTETLVGNARTGMNTEKFNGNAIFLNKGDTLRYAGYDTAGATTSGTSIRNSRIMLGSAVGATSGLAQMHYLGDFPELSFDKEKYKVGEDIILNYKNVFNTGVFSSYQILKADDLDGAPLATRTPATNSNEDVELQMTLRNGGTNTDSNFNLSTTLPTGEYVLRAVSPVTANTMDISFEILSNDNALSNLTLTNSTAWSKTFDPDTMAYVVYVNNATSNITATVRDTGKATAVVNGGNITGLAQGGEVMRSVTVTAEDGSQRTYLLSVIRGTQGVDFSKNTDLAPTDPIMVNGVPAERGADGKYSIIAPNNIFIARVQVSAVNANSIVRFANEQIVPEAKPVHTAFIDLMGENTTVTITVLSESFWNGGDMTAMRVYELVIRKRSTDKTLSDLKVTNGNTTYNLSPAFDPAHTAYSITIPNDVTSVNVDATVNQAGAQITGGLGLAENILTTINRTIRVTVLSENDIFTESGTPAVYTITVIREKDNVATLSALTVNGNSFDNFVPDAEPDPDGYFIAVLQSVTSANIDAEVTDGSMATINAADLGSKAMTQSGTYNFDVRVTSENGDVVNTYKITVRRNQRFTINFVDAGSLAPSTVFVQEGDKVVRPTPDPTKAFNDFVEWYADEEFTEEFDFDSLTWEGKQIYALWSPQKVTVTFDLDYDEIEPEVIELNRGAALGEFFPTPERRPGYGFIGWYNQREGGSPINSTTIINPGGGQDNLNVWARWEERDEFEVTYDINGAEGDIPVEVPRAEGEKFPAAQIDGFSHPDEMMEFVEWNDEIDENGLGVGTAYAPGAEITMGNDALSLYAVWKAKDPHTVTYDLNGGTGDAPEETEKYKDDLFILQDVDEDVEAPADTVFNGWNTEADGTGTAYAVGAEIKMPDANLTLYAQWLDENADTYDLVLDANYGDLMNVVKGWAEIVSINDSNSKMFGVAASVLHEEPCDVCGEDPCECPDEPCDVCGEEPCECPDEPCEVCGEEPCECPDEPCEVCGEEPCECPDEPCEVCGEEPCECPEGPCDVCGEEPCECDPELNQVTTEVLEGKVLLVPDNPFEVPAGMEFAGWNDQADGEGEEYAAGTTFIMPGANFTLFAVWEDLPEYDVTYDLNDGTGIVPLQDALKEGFTFTAAGIEEIIAPEGKQFVEWNTESDGTGTAYAPGDEVTMGAEDLTLYAIWEDIPAVKYTVTYNLNGGTGTAPTQADLEEGEKFEIPTAAGMTAPEGQQFKTWNSLADGTGDDYAPGTEVTMGTENVSFWAIWEDVSVVKYTVTYNLNGGTGTAPTQADLEEGEKFTIPTSTGMTAPAGQQFKTWNSLADGTGTDYAPGTEVTVGTENMSFWAIWENIPVVNRTVTFNGNGVPNPSARTVVSGTAIGTLPTVSRANHTFAGWFTALTGGTQVTAATIVNANITVFARWTPITWTVNFMDGSRNLTNLRKVVNNNTRVTNPNPPAKKNQTFVGWFTSNTGGSQFNFGRNIVANVTLYARYESNPARPTKMKATRSKRKARVSWKKQNGVTVEIQQRIGAKGKWTRTGTTKKAGANSFTTKNLRKGRRYQFRARAIKRIAGRVVRSAWSGASKALLIR